MQYAIYLRKSRADMEAEQYGEGETLARHQAQLLELAKRQNLFIGEIYKELVSGETIESRPVMQHLLEEINQGKWAGVIVMEIERLARGDTIDQGIVAQAFKYSGTKILTPTKTYDPSNEFDEEYFEFNLFMSRREYKTIRRRMQAGRMASVKEGNYIGSQPPFGYKKVHDYKNKAFTLEPIENEAETVKLMYDLFINQDMGYTKIATYLTKLGILPKRTNEWSGSSVNDIINNPLYCGKLRWEWRKTKKTIVDGKTTISRPKGTGVVFQGNHPAIISEEIWNKAQQKSKGKCHSTTHFEGNLKNYYTGLMYCKLCGHAISRRPYKNSPPQYLCKYKMCECMSSAELEIDEALISDIKLKLYECKNMLATGEKQINCNDNNNIVEKNINIEIEKLNKQQNRLHDLLEQEVYTTEVFLQRSSELSARLTELKNMQETAKQNQKQTKSLEDIIITLENILEQFGTNLSGTDKNELLKTAIKQIDYYKTQGGRYKTSNLELSVLYIF